MTSCKVTGDQAGPQLPATRAPAWFRSMLASSQREQRRLRDELAAMRGFWPLLLKRGAWTPAEEEQLKRTLRSASSLSPYVFVWALPGSVLLLPFLAWYLDVRRHGRA
jgi:hypothetical protein